MMNATHNCAFNKDTKTINMSVYHGSHHEQNHLPQCAPLFWRKLVSYHQSTLRWRIGHTLPSGWVYRRDGCAIHCRWVMYFITSHPTRARACCSVSSRQVYGHVEAVCVGLKLQAHKTLPDPQVLLSSSVFGRRMMRTEHARNVTV
jgi:hypothetical protein